MPNKCCVPGCKSNYGAGSKQHVNLFSFPKDQQLRQLWLRKIPRSFEPTKYSFVCIKHFDDRFIVRDISFRRPDGSNLKVKRVRPTLSPNAYPTIFPATSRSTGHSSSHNIARKRTSPRNLTEDKLRPILPQSGTLSHFAEIDNNAKIVEGCVTDSTNAIQTFQGLLNSINQRLEPYRDRGWSYSKNGDQVVITNVTFESVVPTVICAIAIDSELSAKLILGAHEASQDELELMGWNDTKISSWNQIFHCMQLLKSNSQDLKTPLTNDLESVISTLRNIHSNVQTGKHELHRPGDAKTLSFIIEQLELISKKPGKRKYSCELCFWSLSILLNKPSAFNIIKETDIINLPPPDRIFKRMVTDVDSPCMTSTQFTYLEKRAKSLISDKRFVILQIYDLDVTSSEVFEMGVLSSCVSQPLLNKPKHVLAFLITSVFSDFREIALVVPVQTLDGESAYTAANNVITELEKMGFRVLCIIADSTPIYRTMFAKVSGKNEASICVPNPSDPRRPLFLLFDPAHVLKCIRDDWIDQKSVTQTLMYPHPDATTFEMQRANFAIIKSLHEIEKRKDWTKRKAKNLTSRTVNVYRTDRSNMELVLNLFNETTIEALETLGPNEPSLVGWEGTTLFLKTILSWWKTIGGQGNTPGEGVEGKVDSLQSPCFNLFDDLIVWLNQWNDLVSKWNVTTSVAKLTNETASAFEHTLHGLREIVAYLLTEIGVKSIYLSRFRKDFPLSQFNLTGGQRNSSNKLLIMLKNDEPCESQTADQES